MNKVFASLFNILEFEFFFTVVEVRELKIAFVTK